MERTFQVTPAMKRVIKILFEGGELEANQRVFQTIGGLYRHGVIDLKNKLTEHGWSLARSMRANGDI